MILERKMFQHSLVKETFSDGMLFVSEGSLMY